MDWVTQDPVFTKFQPIGIGSRAANPNAAKLFVDFMLSQEGQKIIASFGRVATRRGVAGTLIVLAGVRKWMPPTKPAAA